MSAKHVDRQASQVEHEGGHHDVVGHGQDLAGGGHVGSLCEVYILCRGVGRKKTSVA